MKKWTKRTFKFWLVILLPMAIVCGYFSLMNQNSYESWDNQIVISQQMMEHTDRQEIGSVFSRESWQEKLDTVEANREDSETKSYLYGLTSLLLLILPIIIFVLVRVGGWIWKT